MVSRLGFTIILRNLDDVASFEAVLGKRQFWVISMYRKVYLLGVWLLLRVSKSSAVVHYVEIN